MDKNIRSDYKVDRNKKIYEEYVSSDISFNKLAKKYNISPQRVRFIVNDLKNKGLEFNLSTTDSKEKREEQKNLAITLRESGKYQLALEKFDEVLAWDKAHENSKGLKDVLGHKKILFTLLADASSENSDKKAYLDKAEECLKEASKLFPEDKILYVHLASLSLNNASLFPKDKKKYAEEALISLEKALENFPGSKAHRAWPLSIKARALHVLDRDSEALSVLAQAEQALFEGYDEEMKNQDQGRIKISVWLSGIYLVYAHIAHKQQKSILAEMYANSIISMPDPLNVLHNRKKEAKELLD